jgi:hypothetical protein
MSISMRKPESCGIWKVGSLVFGGLLVLLLAYPRPQVESMLAVSAGEGGIEVQECDC